MSHFKLPLLAFSLSCLFFVPLICNATVVILEPGEDSTLLCNNDSVIWNVTYLNSNLTSTLTPSFPSGSLRIESFERDRAGLYRCVARGSVAASYWVVSSADLFEPFSPNRLMVTEGQQINFVIRTQSFLIDPSNFQEILVYKNGTRIQRLRASNGTASFIVEMAELVDSGNYTFVIHTDTDHESDILEIQVEPLLVSVAPSTSHTPMSIVPTTASMCECSGGQSGESPSSLLSHELCLDFLNDENVAIPQPSSHIVVVTEVITTTEYVTPSSTTCPTVTPESAPCSGHIGGIILLSLLVGVLLIIIAVLIYYFLRVQGRRKYNTSDTPKVDTMGGDDVNFENPSSISQNEDSSPLILHLDMGNNSHYSSQASTPQGPQPFGPDVHSIGPHSSTISLSTNSSSSPRPGKVSVPPKMETIKANESTTTEMVTK